MRGVKQLCIGVAATLPLLAFACCAHAQQKHTEDAVKAAYLYRFAGYVKWPDDAMGPHPFVIDVLGAPGVARELRNLVPGHMINNDLPQIREITRLQELGAAQILYVGAGHDEFLRVLAQNDNLHMLVVTDDERGLELGSVLNFVTVDKRVRFEISLTAADRAHLKISSELLSVAIRVHGGSRQSGVGCIPLTLPDDGEAQCPARLARRMRLDPAADAARPRVRWILARRQSPANRGAAA
jgi:hypothetical protein